MSTTLTISDDLAAALEERRRDAGMPSLDAAAEALLSRAIALDTSDAADFGLSEELLRALIDEGEASGEASAWDAAAVRAEVHRRWQQSNETG